MTLTVRQLRDYSWMSQAAYLDFTGFSSGTFDAALEARLKDDQRINAHNIFADEQARSFTGSNTSDPSDGFSFVSYAPNYQDTGFSATVFRNNTDNSYTIAVRGTEPEQILNSEDLFRADALGVVLQGKALEQLFVGYRYYKQMTATGGNSNYSQQELTAMAALLVTAHDKNVNTALFLISPVADAISTWVSGLTFEERVQSMVAALQPILSNDPSIGAGAIPPGATINFTGHSLGGHVAALLAEMVAEYGNSTIGDIATYNAPGINALSYEIDNWLHAGTATTQTGVLANRVAVVADGGIDVTAGLGLTNGIVQRIFIEASSNPISTDNHSIVKLSDSLTVKNLFATLDATFNQDDRFQQFETYIKQASNTHANTLEKLLDGLRKAILGGNLTSTVVSGSEESLARESLYSHIQELANSPNLQSLIGKVTIQAPPTTAAEARNDFGAFLSLFYLTPFALTANNAEANNLLLAIHTALGDKWTDDYNLSDEAKQNGEANFSDLWLADRAAMQSWMNLRNKYDLETSEGQQVANNGLPNVLEAASQRYYFQDMASGTEIYLGTSEDRRKFIFGSNEADTVEGDDNSDHLYGMDGNDTVNGDDGNDYIEGNAGQDSLNGGEGNDILLGGTGEDVLDGGIGNDQLKGGAGVDVYQFNGAFGTDVIIDSDGQGSLIADSNPLVGGDKKLENIYKHEGTGYVYSRVNDGKTILVTKEGSNNRIIINEWSEDKNLNISLSGEMPAAPNATPGLTGDFKKEIDDKGTSSTDDDDVYVMTDGNYTRDESALDGEPGAADLITGTDAVVGIGGEDVIYGLGGDDALFGLGGDDWIEGGKGTDVLQGGLGKDTIDGGEGHDFIYGSSTGSTVKPVNANFNLPSNPFTYQTGAGFNWISGYNEEDIYSNGAHSNYLSISISRDRQEGDEGNYINGGTGDDFIAAGTGADYVHGDADQDEIWGMDKDDILFGDGGNDVIYGDGDKQSSESVIWTLGTNHGNDILDGGVGDDILLGQGGNDIIFGGDNDDTIWGDDDESSLPQEFHGNDYLDGGSGNDTMDAGAGDDTIIGGEGNDILNGGAGRDTFIFNKGDGIDHIYDDFSANGGNTVHFGVGINKNDIKLGKGSLLLDLGSGDALHIEGFNSQDVYSSVAIDRFEFADGSVLTSHELLAQGFDLEGTGNNDVIVGTNIEDRIRGQAGSDTLFGQADDDNIDGGEGDDFLFGGDGNDQLLGGSGQDQLVGDAGADILDGGIGEDNLFGGGDDDHLIGGDGADKLIGDGVDVEIGGADTLDGGAGNDILWGHAGNDFLNGGSDGDDLQGGEGNDQLTGGTGNDILLGEAGDDTYVLNQGDGQDYINDLTGANVIAFGEGITLESLRVTLGTTIQGKQTVTIKYGDTDSVTLGRGTLAAMQYQFSDGHVIDYSTLLSSLTTPAQSAQDSTLYGTQHGETVALSSNINKIVAGGGDDYLYGNSGNNVLEGGNGNDTIHGDGGDDFLEGGIGNDSLYGSMGSDTYFFARGDGQDTISELHLAEDSNALQFSADILFEDVTFNREPNGDLKIDIVGSADSITIRNWYNDTTYQVNRIVFGDGREVGKEFLEALTVPTITSEYASTLQGTKFDDLIVGSSGDDTLIGAFGVDTLIGGEGEDTYVLGWGRGGLTLIEDIVHSVASPLDSVIETDGGLNTIALPMGMDFSNLNFKQQGNDLLIEVKGSRNADYSNIVYTSNTEDWVDNSPDGLLLKDYFTGTQTWQFKNAASEIRSLNDVMQEALLLPLDWKQRAFEDWKFAAKQSYFSELALAHTDYVQIDANSFEWSASYGHGIEAVKFQEYFIDDQYIYFEDYLIEYWSIPISSHTIEVPSGQYSSSSSSYSSGSTTATPVYDYGNLDSTGNPQVVGFINTSHGQPSGTSSYPATFTVTVVDYSEDYYAEGIRVVYAGDSDNIIDMWWTGMSAFAGGGNDIIWGDNTWGPYRWSYIGYFLDGGEGDDIVVGSGANDVIVGGSGNDFLSGGSGDDSYLIDSNDTGIKIIDEVFYRIEPTSLDTYHQGGTDASETLDTVEFGPGLSANEVIVLRGTLSPEADIPGVTVQDIRGEILDPAITFDTLDITWGDRTQTIRVVLTPSNWFDPWAGWKTPAGFGVEYYKFADGTMLTSAQMEALADSQPINNAPTIGDPISNVTTLENEAFIFTIPEDSFVDTDVHDILTYSATLADGSALPSWLSFDAETKTFSGIPENADVGNVSLQVTVADAAGAVASSTFTVSVTNVNDVPVVNVALVDQAADEDALFSFTVPADSFADVDLGDTLTYSVTLADGSALPSWLSFDAETKTFRGTPENADVGSVGVHVTATDAAGAAASSIFNIEVANINDAPVVNMTIADQTTGEDTLFNFTVPANTFADIDLGDTFSYSATLADGNALPSWLSFDAATRTFSGAPENADVGSLSVQVTATDAAGAFASSEFSATVLNTNDTPMATDAIADQSTDEDVLFSFTVPANTFVDVDAGDTLTYSATLADGSALPSWLSFDAHTYTFSGIPENADVGNLNLKVWVADAAGASVSSDFNVTVTNTNDVPIINGSIPNQTAHEGQAFSLQVSEELFVDVDLNDELSYSAKLVDGNVLPAWLSFNAYDLSFTGVPNNEDIGNWQIQLTATDLNGASASTLFNLDLPRSPNQVLIGDEAGNLLIAGTGHDNIEGMQGSDELYGGAGNDILNGGKGSDLLEAGSGNDTLQFNADALQIWPMITYNHGSPGNPGSGDVAFSLLRWASNDYFDGGIGTDTLNGTSGWDLITLDDENGEAGIASIEAIYAGAGQDIVNLTSTQNSYDDIYVSGGEGDDVLWSNQSLDILQGGDGEDQLDSGIGRGLLDGGMDNDSLRGGNDSDFFVGGKGRDNIITEDGENIIAFNAGDGIDTLHSSSDANNTLSLGGGIEYSELELRRSGKDLVLKVSSTDQIVFDDWYDSDAGPSVVNLQVITEAMEGFSPNGSDSLLDNKIETFDFAAIVNKFDEIRSFRLFFNNWSISDALLDFHLSGSDTAAIGGDLAYQYGKAGSLAGIAVTAAQGIIADSNFGQSAQALQPLASLQEGLVKLS